MPKWWNKLTWTFSEMNSILDSILLFPETDAKWWNKLTLTFSQKNSKLDIYIIISFDGLQMREQAHMNL